MMEHVCDSLLRFKIYEITTCAIGYLDVNYYVLIKKRPKDEVKNIMTKLERASVSDNDKHSKHHQYTLDEAFQAVLKFRDESDYSDLSD